MGNSCTKEDDEYGTSHVQTSVYYQQRNSISPAQQQQQASQHQAYVATVLQQPAVYPQQAMLSSRSVASSHPGAYTHSQTISNYNNTNNSFSTPPRQQSRSSIQPASAPASNLVMSPLTPTSTALQAEADVEAMWGRQDTEHILAQIAATESPRVSRPVVNRINLNSRHLTNNPEMEEAFARSLSSAREDNERRQQQVRDEADMAVVLEMIRDQEEHRGSHRTAPPISDSDSSSSGAPVPLRDCPVCLEERCTSEIVFLHCMHSLCRSCCTDWAAKRRQQEVTICCPICNTDLPEEVVISLNL